MQPEFTHADSPSYKQAPYIAVVILRYVPSIPAFWRVFFFYHKWMLNFVKGFLCIY